jgi:hypothetical protein
MKKVENNVGDMFVQLFGLSLKAIVHGIILVIVGTVLCVGIFTGLTACLAFAVWYSNPFFLLPILGAFLLFVFIWMRL